MPEGRRFRVGVHGAGGRMGATVIDLIGREYGARARVAARVGRREGALADFRDVDVVVDFSLPDGMRTLLDWYDDLEGERPMLVSGTTGLSDELYARLAGLAASTVVLHATNFSVGIAALAEILQFAAPMLEGLSYRPRMTEVHHVHKLDAPSGTAISLCEALRPGDPGGVPIESIREGEVIGTHTVTFSGDAEEIVIGHAASDRSLFARGAIEAALWLAGSGEACGQYSMKSYVRKRFSG